MQKPEWILRISNKQYDIYDCVLDGVVVSITCLKPQQETNGHSHKHSELYIGISDGVSLNGKPLVPLSTITIPADMFHKSFNNTDENKMLLCLWEKY